MITIPCKSETSATNVPRTNNISSTVKGQRSLGTLRLEVWDTELSPCSSWRVIRLKCFY
jgi:hypothetical protein